MVQKLMEMDNQETLEADKGKMSKKDIKKIASDANYTVRRGTKIDLPTMPGM